MTIQENFSCFFEKNTVCSHTLPGGSPGQLLFFMAYANEKDELDFIEVHYKDGYHICKEYQRLNSLNKK